MKLIQEFMKKYDNVMQNRESGMHSSYECKCDKVNECN